MSSIRFQVSGSAPVDLAGDGREDTADFQPSFTDQVQTVLATLRSEVGDQHNRGNRLVAVPFSVARQHDNEAAAKAYLLRHIKEIPARVGTLTIISSAGAGGPSETMELARATVRISASRHSGATTFHTYEAQGRLETS